MTVVVVVVVLLLVGDFVRGPFQTALSPPPATSLTSRFSELLSNSFYIFIFISRSTRVLRELTTYFSFLFLLCVAFASFVIFCIGIIRTTQQNER